MGNENSVPPEKIDPTSSAKKIYDGLNELDKELGPMEEIFEDLPPGAPSTKRPLTTDDIPQMVGQIAELVKHHFQEQINTLIDKVNNLEKQVSETNKTARSAIAKAAKVDVFTEKLYDDITNHYHGQ